MRIQIPYDESKYVAVLHYTGLDFSGLDEMNRHFGSNGFGDFDPRGGCSITFAKYRDGTVGAVRNMDLQCAPFGSYELFIKPGPHVKYPVWGLVYTGMDQKSFRELLVSDVSDERYASIPFTATDSMSFGSDENGNPAALYCAILMRSEQPGENGGYDWACTATCPGAPIRCCTQSLTTLLTAQCITIEQALQYVGAVDESGKRLFPNVAPTLDVYTFNIETPTYSNHWFEVIAMEDATGRHGVLEFLDNHAIWHENAAYSFNFFLQKEYLYREDGSYREVYGVGLGRYAATVPYLDQIHTVSDHVALMDNVRYSHATYYNEEQDYIGRDWLGNPIDWRSEYTHADVFAICNRFRNILKLNTSEADRKYPLWANYRNTQTGEIEKITSLDDYLANAGHLEALWTLDYVMAEENREEVMNFIRWNGLNYCNMTPAEVAATNAGWETYFRVVADPMHGAVTRWFNEDILTAGTITRKTWEQLP